jgi:hypothetical protein
MNVIYGGLDLRIVRMLNFERQPVLSDDGTTYLFTKFTINAVGLVNSQRDPLKPTAGLGQSKVRGSNLSPFAVIDAVEPDTNPVVTDVAIRHWMSVPRRQLVVSSGAEVLLTSPELGLKSDAKNGPICEAYSVHEIMGAARTFVVHFQVTTFVNECKANTGQVAGLLANRWRQTHELNADYGLTIVTGGEAYFRTDLVRDKGIGPDLLRPYLFLPIPVGFQREGIQVHAPSDGSSLVYQFVDVQKSDQFVAGQEIAASHIQATYREALQSDADLMQTMMDAADKYYQVQWYLNQDARNAKAGTGRFHPGPAEADIKSAVKNIKRGGFGSGAGTFKSGGG